jgi:hypothetical protein
MSSDGELEVVGVDASLRVDCTCVCRVVVIVRRATICRASSRHAFTKAGAVHAPRDDAAITSEGRLSACRHVSTKAGAVHGWRDCAAPRSAGWPAARAARIVLLTRRGCPSEVSAANAASSATGRSPEHRREVGAKRRPPRQSATREPHPPLPRQSATRAPHPPLPRQSATREPPPPLPRQSVTRAPPPPLPRQSATREPHPTSPR